MNRPRPRGGHADTDLPRELGVRTSHKRRHLLMPHLHEVDRPLRPLQRPHDPVDAVPGIPVNAVDAPGLEAFDEKVGCGFRHDLRRSTKCARFEGTPRENARTRCRAKRRTTTCEVATTSPVAYAASTRSVTQKEQMLSCSLPV